MNVKICDYCDKKTDLIELHNEDAVNRFVCLKHLKKMLEKQK